MGERRQELFILFRNTAKVAPSQACTYVAARLQAAFSTSSSVQVHKCIRPRVPWTSGPQTPSEEAH